MYRLLIVITVLLQVCLMPNYNFERSQVGVIQQSTSKQYYLRKKQKNSTKLYKGHGTLAANCNMATLEKHVIRTSAEKQSSSLAVVSTVCTGLLAELGLFHTSCHCVTICSRSKISCDLSCGNTSPFLFWVHCVFSISVLRLALHGATWMQQQLCAT